MNTRILLCLLALTGLCLHAVSEPKPSPAPAATYKVQKSDAEWRKTLSPEAYNVLRKAGTEAAFSGEHNDEKRAGSYVCAGCGEPLFQSTSKFDSRCGWPSFYKPAGQEAVVEETDKSHDMVRTEILCSGCGGHLGHVFNDGPPPTGLRYCINSDALVFKPAAK